MSRYKGLTLVEAMIIVICVAVLAAVLIPALAPAPHRGAQMASTTEVRGMIQGMIVYAQGNNLYYPGLLPSGTNDLATPPTAGYAWSRANDSQTIFNGYILAKLLQGGYFTPDYAISPHETRRQDVLRAASVSTGSNCVTIAGTNSSYAFLKVGDPSADAGRRAEWRDTSNSLAVLASDRGNGQGGLGNTLSIHTTVTGDATTSAKDAKNWRGTIGWNDNHTEYATTAILVGTKYDKSANVGDDIFSDTLIDSSVPGATSTPGANALMQYTTW